MAYPRHQSTMDHHGSDQGSSEWRISYVNFDYRICPTYPRAVVVPAAMGDEVLRCSAQFRSVPNVAFLIFMGQTSPVYDECQTQSAKFCHENEVIKTIPMILILPMTPKTYT